MLKPVSFEEARHTHYPKQVVIAIAKDRDGKANPISIGRFMAVSHEPPMLAIAVGKTRYTAETIVHSECFTVAVPSIDMADVTLLFGTRSGRDIDKLAASGCTIESARTIDSVLLSDAVVNYECELESYFPAGDHLVFIGKVVASHLNEESAPCLYITGPEHQIGPIGS